MLWPLLCIDNFFDDPDSIVEYANKQEYAPNFYPGLRTQSLHHTDNEFFIWVNEKILSLLYPNDYKKLFWRTATHFQKVPQGLEHDGWVHQDENEFTCIVYLSKHKNCGTSIFTPIDQYSKALNDQVEKVNYFQNYKEYKDLEKLKDTKDLNNSKFDESIIIKSKYNRLVLFDARSYHAAQPYIGTTTEDRLTLISFFHGVQYNIGECNLKYPISEMRRI